MGLTGVGFGASSATTRGAYVVKKGDTLSRIASSFGIRLRALKRRNRLKGDRIRVGQRLRLPRGARRHARPAGKARMRLLTHRVQPGEFLGEIAKKYGVTVRDIVRLNRLKSRHNVRVGRKLQIRTRQPHLELCTKTYRVAAGDSISRIMKRFKVTRMDVLYHNPRLKNLNRIRIGQKLRIVKACPPAESTSQSVGRTNAGRLVNGVRLPCGKREPWHCRTPRRSWGTRETIRGIRDAVEEVNNRFARTHRVTIEHISAEHGGHLRPHLSHQSGRDVDIGFYFRNQKRPGPKRFLDATKHALDYSRTWALLDALIYPAKGGTRVQHIFCDYRVQKALYRWAVRRGKPKAKLKAMFQYPRGRRKLVGVIRHVKGHSGHLHVRFGCPHDDKNCKR